MLFVELAKAVSEWLWRSGKIDNKWEFDLDCFGGLVVERARGRTQNIDGEVEPIAWCD
jgi:hypothetical protein